MKQYVGIFGNLDMCTYGLLGPSGYYYDKPTSLVHNFGDSLQPVFRRCSNGLGGGKAYDWHQPIEGNSPSSRTKLAQVYPYRFRLTLVKTILPIGNVRNLMPAQSGLAIDLLNCFSADELISIEKDARSVYTDNEHIVRSNIAGKHAASQLPVNNRDVKRAMNITNSFPNGSYYDPLKLSLHYEIALMRKLYISTMRFENATITRGSLQPLRVQNRHTAGVLLLWHKRENTKIHLILYPEVDISNLIQQHDKLKCYAFWDNDNSAPRYVHPDPIQHTTSTRGLDPPDVPMIPPPDEQPPDERTPQQPDPLDPDYGTPGHPPLDDPPQSPPRHPTFDTPLSPECHSPPHSPDPPDEDMPFRSPQPEPHIPTAPIFPGPGPGPGPPPPGGAMIPVGSSDLVRPQTHIPTVIVPPNIPDEQMQRAQKRLQQLPLPWPPAHKAKMAPVTQMPPRASASSNHLGGKVVAKILSQVAPHIPDSDEGRDPTAAPSGHQQPLLPYENAENDPLDMPPQQEPEQSPAQEPTQESEEDEKALPSS